MAIRSEMFGELTRSHLENADDFTRDLQDLVTTYCFGAVWGRDGLDRRTRSMLTIALLAAQGRETELSWHVRGAIANGVTKDEVKEVLLHTAVYAGIPAGVSGTFRAREIYDEVQEA